MIKWPKKKYKIYNADASDYEISRNEGWNAAIDEMRRINQPAEPSGFEGNQLKQSAVDTQGQGLDNWEKRYIDAFYESYSGIINPLVIMESCNWNINFIKKWVIQNLALELCRCAWDCYCPVHDKDLTKHTK